MCTLYLFSIFVKAVQIIFYRPRKHLYLVQIPTKITTTNIFFDEEENNRDCSAQEICEEILNCWIVSLQILSICRRRYRCVHVIAQSVARLTCVMISSLAGGIPHMIGSLQTDDRLSMF